jgi:hypothetical protein
MFVGGVGTFATLKATREFAVEIAVVELSAFAAVEDWWAFFIWLRGRQVSKNEYGSLLFKE